MAPSMENYPAQIVSSAGPEKPSALFGLLSDPRVAILVLTAQARRLRSPGVALCKFPRQLNKDCPKQQKIFMDSDINVQDQSFLSCY